MFRCVASFSRFLILLVVFMFSLSPSVHSLADVVWAVNCGGEAHVDVRGIRYQKDTLTVGSASNHGRHLNIQRAASQDRILYQTERYHTSNFAYEVPIKEDGDYVLILKFSEVWFKQPNQKVFSVRLNEHHTAVANLDIYQRAGYGVAHDEIIQFATVGGMFKIGIGPDKLPEAVSPFEVLLKIEFIKQADNPKINAIAILKGRKKNVAMFPLLNHVVVEKEEEENQKEEVKDAGVKKIKSGPNVKRPHVIDPYLHQDTFYSLIPVLVAISASIPFLFCLCRL